MLLTNAASEREGFAKLLNYIRKSDFYTAPASTKYHLSCEGGLLQHSLNVYDCLMGKARKSPFANEDGTFDYVFEVAGKPVLTTSESTIVIASLLHDLCKTRFYEIENRWRKDENNKWEQYPVYTINDKNPYGHGEKSVMMIEEFIRLTMEERYAIRWHMGMADCNQNDLRSYNAAVEKFPLVHFLHCSDQEATHFIEDTDGNKAEIQI